MINVQGNPMETNKSYFFLKCNYTVVKRLFAYMQFPIFCNGTALTYVTHSCRKPFPAEGSQLYGNNQKNKKGKHKHRTSF